MEVETVYQLSVRLPRPADPISVNISIRDDMHIAATQELKRDQICDSLDVVLMYESGRVRAYLEWYR